MNIRCGSLPSSYIYVWYTVAYYRFWWLSTEKKTW
jgi:hypothetical protein